MTPGAEALIEAARARLERSKDSTK